RREVPGAYDLWQPTQAAREKPLHFLSRYFSVGNERLVRHDEGNDPIVPYRCIEQAAEEGAEREDLAGRRRLGPATRFGKRRPVQLDLFEPGHERKPPGNGVETLFAIPDL